MYSLKIKKVHIEVIFILLLMHDFLYLAPTTIGPIRYSDIVFIVPVLIIIGYWIRDKRRFFTGTYKGLILFVPILIFFSSLAAYINYNQNILSGILTQRNWLSTAMLYFVFHSMIRKNRLNYKEFQTIIYGIACVELILYFVQFFVGENHVFLNVIHNMRYDTLRLYCNTNYMVLAAMMSMERLLKKDKVIFNATIVAAVISYYVIVNKGRGDTMAFLLGLIFIIMLSETKWYYKLVTGILAVIVGICIFADMELIQDFFLTIANGQEVGTYGVRLKSIEYYMKIWGTSWFSRIFGFGYANSNIAESIQATGSVYGYNYADNGVFGFLSAYGIVGMFWLVRYTYVRIKAGIQLRKKESAIVLAYALVIFFQFPTMVTYFYTYHSFDMVLILVTIELLNKHCFQSVKKGIIHDERKIIEE